LTAKACTRGERVPTLARRTQSVDQLIALTPELLLFVWKTVDGSLDVTQESEGVGAAVPIHLQRSHRVDGAPLRGSYLIARSQNGSTPLALEPLALVSCASSFMLVWSRMCPHTHTFRF
jgi:hypothetical protein